jgi:hypothetical protein
VIFRNAADPDGDGEFTVEAIVRPAMQMNEFQGGFIRNGHHVYEILNNDAKGNLTARKMDASQPLPHEVAVLSISLGNAVPKSRLDPSSFNPTDQHPGIYSMVQSTTDRSENRFAVSYLQPKDIAYVRSRTSFE